MCNYSEPKSSPDSEGWWAFEGKWIHNVETFQMVLEVVEDEGRLFTDFYMDMEPIAAFTGKWYRLTMPWEAQP